MKPASELGHGRGRRRATALGGWGILAAIAASVAAATGCAPSGAGSDPAAETVTLRSALTSNVVVTVTDENGAPQSGREVLAENTGGNFVASGWTNAQGLATVAVDPGDYRFATPEGGIFLRSGAAGHCTTPSCASAEIVIRHVDVTVVDTSGTPRPDLLVVWFDTAGGGGAPLTTGANGHALLALPPASYQFKVRMNGLDFYSGAEGHCTVPSCTAATITVTVPIAVTVVDTTGAPRVNELVVWEDTEANEGGWITTNASGVAVLSVPPGDHRFKVRINGRYFTSGAAGHCEVPGCTTATITVTVPIVVTVVDSDGVPQPNLVVAWEDANQNEDAYNATDQSGHASVSVEPGTYRFKVNADDTRFASGPTPHCTVPGCTAATITISKPTVVTLVDTAGQPVAATTVYATSTEGEAAYPHATDAAGHASFRLLPGHWRFKAWCGSEYFWSGEPGHCLTPDCQTAQIVMACGQCDGQTNGTACNDGNPCSQTDTCQNSACTGSNPITCAAQDQCHDAGACSAATGACTNPPKTNGASCSDGDGCTTGDSCQGGACTPGAGSCAALTVSLSTGGVTAAPQLSATLVADQTTVVPGDLVTFTSQVTNSGTNVDFNGGSFGIANPGAQPFVVAGYQRTLEYFSVAEQAWIPFARLAVNAAGTLVPETTLVQINYVWVSTSTSNGATFSPNPVVGTTIQPGGNASWTYRSVASLPADVAHIVFDPAQASDLRAVLRFDVPSGPPASGVASLSAPFSGVTGAINDVTALVNYSLIANGTGPLSSTSTGPLAPGESRIFSGSITAPALHPLIDLSSAIALGYTIAVIATGHAAHTDPAVLTPGHLNLQVPIITPVKSGPPGLNAGLTANYTVTLPNTGNTVAGPFTVVDSVDGTPIAGAVVTTPATVAPSASGTATVAAPTPLERPAGPMTDVVAVTWQDRNGNVYGPASSSFTTALAAGHPEGYLSIAGATSYPDLLGGQKTLTVTALDPHGQPVSGLVVNVAVTGVHPQTANVTTGAGGTATFAYTGSSLGTDTIAASATIATGTAQATPAQVRWASSVGTPCTGRGDPLDVMLVIDASPSMLGAKIEAARAASKKFIDTLDFAHDQVGAVLFSGNAELRPQLTGNATQAKASLDAGIDAFINACSGFCLGGSNIPVGLNAAMDELASARHRPGATPVIVFLSDGFNTGADPTAALARLDSQGIRAVAIGLGADVDGALLRGIATTSNDYFYSPTAAELEWVYSQVNHDVCRESPPLVDAGGDQGVYDVRLPNMLTLQGEVHDDGPDGDVRLTTEWTVVSGPGTVTFTDATSPITQVLFAEPGTYVLQLAASDGFLTVADRATITVDPDPSLAGASLVVSLGAAGPLTIGAAATVTATLTDATSAPIANFPIALTIAGANAGSATAITNASGVAAFSYNGGRAGTDLIHATALGTTTQVTSAIAALTWTEPATGGPLLTQGWISAPTHQTTVLGQVPVVLSNDVTLASGTITYWPVAAPAQIGTLATGLTGNPGATLATFDTTLLANGSYILKLDGTDNGGNAKTSQVMVTVAGDYKPGRVVVEVTDFSIPVAGMPITVGRRYDSLEKHSVGDFGNGWSLLLGHPKLEVNPGYGVTLTMPEGRRVSFRFAPTFPVGGPVIFGFLLLPKYEGEPGVFGKLTSNGCSLLSFNPWVSNPTPICLENILDPVHLEYAPTEYTYTDPYGRAFVMAATGELKSIKDRSGNTLTFTATGIASSAGPAVTFERDTSGRITKVISPGVGPSQVHVETRYAYDTAGNLESVDHPPANASAVTHYTYDAHRLLTTVDPRGNPARTSTYYTDGRLATDRDALNHVTSYTYFLATRTTQTTYPDTGVRTEIFDPQGMLLSETDPLNHTTTHEYDANRNETKVTNALNEVTTAIYDDRGNQTSKTTPVGTTHTTYDAFNLPVTFTDALQHVTTIAYDDRGAPTRFADELGTRFRFMSSEQGVPLTVDDAEGKRAYLTYDGAGNVTSRTDWIGRVTRATYDELGRKLTETSARQGVRTSNYTWRGKLANVTESKFLVDQNGTTTIVPDVNGARSFEYDQNDNVVLDRVIWAGRSTAYAYDALNRVTTVTNGDNTTAHYTYDFRGNKLTEVDESNRTTTHEYDLAGRLTKTIFADGTFVTRTYDALGRLHTATDERNNTTTYAYQPGCGCSDRVTTVTDPLNRTTTTAYDPNGRRSSVTDASNRTTTFEYDVRGHLTDTHYVDTTTVHDTYDPRGRRTSTTDQMGKTTFYGYDDQGQLTSVTDPLQNVTTYTYDPDGNLQTVTDANTHVTSYAYDLQKRKTKRTLPLGMFESFAYDLVGNQTAHTDFRGKTTAMTYDLRDRLLTKVPDATLGEPTVNFTYYPTGTRSSMTDASGSTTYTYDQRNRLLTKAATAGTLTYTYDPAGNLATIRSSNTNGTSVDYAWDNANQLSTVTDNRAGGVTTSAYTPTGRPNTLSQPNGINAAYSYDSLDRITSMLWKHGTSPPPFASWGYTHNGRGQRLTSTDISGRQAAYGYDDAARLESETITGASGAGGNNGAIAYVLDGAGNRLSRTSALTTIPSATYSYDANDQLAFGGYDANGNTISSAGNAFAYDFDNRLVSTNGGVLIAYDAEGNRVAKTVDGVTIRYLVDDLNPTGYLQVLEEIVSGNVQTRYTYGTNIVSQTRNVSTSPATGYYGYDAQGNITFVADASGSVTDSYDYDAWGVLLANTGSTPNSRLYAGEEFDPSLGLINLRARQYEPATGRFLRIDPLDAPPAHLPGLGSTMAGYMRRSDAHAPSDFPGHPAGSRLSEVVDDPCPRAVLEFVGVDAPRSSGRLLLPMALHRYAYANQDPVNLIDPSGLGAINEYFAMLKTLYPRAHAILLGALYGIHPVCGFKLLVDLLTCGDKYGTISPRCVSQSLRGYLRCRMPGGRN